MRSVRRVRLALACVSIIAISLMFAGISSAEIDMGTCVGLWLFDEGTGEIAGDSSGTGNDGAIKNGPKWVEGKFGRALEFDGADDVVEIEEPKKLDLTAAVTVSMLLKAPDDDKRSFVLSKNDNKGGFRLEVKPTLYWCVEKGDALKSVKSTLPKEVWVHVVGTYDGKVLTLYLDGVNAGSVDVVDGLANVDKSLVIGAHRSSGDLPLNGSIDEVAIFNVALGEADIQAIADKGLAAALGTAAVEAGGKLSTSWAAIRAQ